MCLWEEITGRWITELNNIFTELIVTDGERKWDIFWSAD